MGDKYAICVDGELTTDFQYEECGSYAYGLLAVCEEGKWGYVDEEGNLVIPTGIFEEILPVYKGKCWVKQNGKWGVIQLEKDAEAVAVNFERSYIAGKECASVSGLDENGSMVWEYETEKYEAAQLDRIFELGEKEGIYLQSLQIMQKKYDKK